MSDDQQFWVRPAMLEEGSFCDTSSGIHYDNLSEEATNKAITSANARGDAVVDFRDTGEGENLRNNCTILAVDGVGFEYPPRYRPGE